MENIPLKSVNIQNSFRVHYKIEKYNCKLLFYKSKINSFNVILLKIYYSLIFVCMFINIYYCKNNRLIIKKYF